MADKFRKVNQSLGDSPRFGPFPANQIIPWITITFACYYIFKIFLNLSWLWTGCAVAWGISTWWVLTGSRSWMFLSKFVNPPNWSRGYGKYHYLAQKKNDSHSKVDYGEKEGR